MDDLKPCPFCGGNANIERIGDSRVSTIVSCDECGCRLENGEEFNHGRGWNTRADTDAIATQSARIAELEALSDRLRIEAQGHAMEARTANSTIAEIYQAISGSKGEPGNWHGAEPVREYVRAAESRATAAEERLKEAERMAGRICNGPYEVTATYIELFHEAQSIARAFLDTQETADEPS